MGGWEEVYRDTIRLNEVRPRRPEQSGTRQLLFSEQIIVSMKSGLEGRNNSGRFRRFLGVRDVSMKPGLEGRNNAASQLEEEQFV